MYCVYALYNKEIDKVYIGQSADLNTRLKLHEDKVFRRSFTGRNPGGWLLVYSEECEDRVAAIKREKQLKSYRGRQFIRQHITI